MKHENPQVTDEFLDEIAGNKIPFDTFCHKMAESKSLWHPNGFETTVGEAVSEIDLANSAVLHLFIDEK